ncbi:MAG TPA: hypothetical protein VGQ11_02745 [Candidatus Acidoferrales bacterium]|nr:hypothetical protein [Candidatus Acidoferrales bacterium]
MASIELPALTAPLPGQPLALLTKPEQLNYAVDTARRLREWARANSQGGDMPVDLLTAVEKAQSLVLGRTPEEIKEGKYFDAEKAAEMFEQADRMINEYVPARRDFVQAENHYLGKLKAEVPESLDPKKPKGQVFARILHSYPQFRQFPEWPLLVRDLTDGFIANTPKAGSPAGGNSQVRTPAPAPVGSPTGTKPAEVPVQGGGTAPLAPAAATSSAAPAGVPVSQARLDQANERMEKGTYTEEDLLILSAAAV